MSRSISIPEELLRRGVRVVRPRDLAEVYASPNLEVRRLAANNVLLHLAHGYYAVPPSEWLGDASWVPEIESAAWGIAAADHGQNAVAVVGVSAARVLGFVPRALARAIVSVPVRRRPLRTVAGTVAFWQGHIESLETQSWRSELGLGRVTTVEQTLLDVAARPRRGGVSLATAQEALLGLAGSADWERALRLASENGAMAAYARARWFADAVAPEAPEPLKLRRPVASRGLEPSPASDRSRFFIRDD